MKGNAITLRVVLAAAALLVLPAALYAQREVREYAVPAGSHPHDVAPAPDGRVWYTAQHRAALGWLDPKTGKTGEIALGRGSRPHGVIIGPAGDLWVTDGGLSAIVRVDPVTEEVTRYRLPASRANANLNTGTFDKNGNYWFTGQAGIYGRVNPATGEVETFDAPRGRGPYGIDASVDGYVYYASLAAGYVGRIDPADGSVTVRGPPESRQGTRRIWADSHGVLWVSAWYGGVLYRLVPERNEWEAVSLPGSGNRPYGLYVDNRDMVWISDFGTNSIYRYNPEEKTFQTYALPSRGARVRQLLGRPGEVWGAESGTDKLVVIR